MDVVAYDPYLDADAFASAGVRQASSVEALVVEADVLTLHLPGGGDRPLLDEGMLARLKPGAVLINAARGDLVDEHAIAKALESGALGGYGADAFSTEPPTGSPLLTAPNVVLTPHIGAYTDRANELMGTCVVSDIIAVLDGQVPRHQVTA